MFIRKLVKAGAASYTLALPKEWILENSLNKGDILYIRKVSNSELLISTEAKTEKSSPREITINIENKNSGTLHRELTSAYINNYDTICITGENVYRHAAEIRKSLSDFVALEITEQTSSKIIAKDMLNIKEVSIEKTIRRMDNIVRSILNDIIASDIEMAESIGFRDQDINRLYFLLFKIIKTSLRQPDVAKLVGIDNYADILSLWYMTLNLESISDNALEIFSLSVGVKNEAYFNELSGLYKSLDKSFLEVMKSYHNKDKALADTVALGRSIIISRCSELSEKIDNNVVTKLTENIKEIENCICNIARIVLNKE